MKLAIITPTCRSNPRLDELAKTLAYALSVTAPEVSLHWYIVDEHNREIETLTGSYDRLCQIASGHLLEARVIPPLPSKHRAAGVDRAPAHNSALSAGLLAAMTDTCDYAMFVNDCNVVTYNFINVAYDCQRQHLGFRAKMHEVADMAVPPDGRVAYRDHFDLLRPIPAKNAVGVAWGAPMDAFSKIQGFDLSYDGEGLGGDLDAIIRLARTGVNFVTTERCFVIQMRRTKIAEEITTRKDVRLSVRNKKLLQQLEREKQRITPLWIAGEEQPSPTLVATPAAAPVEDAPKRPPWKRAAPVVGGKRPGVITKAPHKRHAAPVVGGRKPAPAAQTLAVARSDHQHPAVAPNAVSGLRRRTPAPASSAPSEVGSRATVNVAPAGTPSDLDLGQIGDPDELDSAIDEMGDLGDLS